MMDLNYPQHVYLNKLDTKYRAYVGGFGCVSPDTKIWTEFGLMRIADITDPIRVVSWNEKSQKFQLSLSGGSFPKGRENLYRISTQQGEFVSSGHHRFFSSEGKYQRVDDLLKGDLFDVSLPRSNLEFDQLLSTLDVQRYTKKHVNYLYRYATSARRYGQQFLRGEDTSLNASPSKSGARRLISMGGLLPFSHEDVQIQQTLTHSHHGRSFFRTCMSRLIHRLQSHVFYGVNQILTSLTAHTCDGLYRFQLSASKFLRRHTDEQHFPVLHSYLSPSKLIGVTVEEPSPYYDIQVLDTNNYVCEAGFIHHNSGKTFIGCLDLIKFFCEHPGTVQGYFGISYPSIRDIFYPTFEEAAELMGFTCKIKTGDKEVSIYRNGFYYGTVICRSMDNPNSIIGFKISRAMCDEIDVLPRDKANNAWNKIIARMRLKIDGVVNGIGVTTTPEGFKFVYQQFKKDPLKSYSMVQASTYENAKYLPEDYISSLYETYPDQLISAYIRGQFVNLTSGTVYSSYDRVKHNSDETIQQGEPLYIGCDFNVTKQAATVYVKRGEVWHAVRELVDMYDTPDMIRTIKNQLEGHVIYIYPDASGGSRKTVDASTSDIALLQQAGFIVKAHKKNPNVKDRILATNAAFDKGLIKINAKACPVVAQCLEQQAYNTNGQPDKASGDDHQNDATTYPIAFEMPIIKPVANIKVRFAT